MKRHTTIALAGALAAVLVSCKREERSVRPVAPAPGPGAGAPMPTPQQRIAVAEQLAAREPNSARAWTQLGNEYFDAHQYQKAIDAYSKALELQPDNPDVLTDQGVMYREVRAYDKAVANFERAQQIDPAHVQSAFNLGVVYAYDLQKPDKAAAAWKRVIEIAPTSPDAARARQALDHLAQQQPQAR